MMVSRHFPQYISSSPTVLPAIFVTNLRQIFFPPFILSNLASSLQQPSHRLPFSFCTICRLLPLGSPKKPNPKIRCCRPTIAGHRPIIRGSLSHTAITISIGYHIDYLSCRSSSSLRRLRHRSTSPPHPRPRRRRHQHQPSQRPPAAASVHLPALACLDLLQPLFLRGLANPPHCYPHHVHHRGQLFSVGVFSVAPPHLQYLPAVSLAAVASLVVVVPTVPIL